MKVNPQNWKTYIFTLFADVRKELEYLSNDELLEQFDEAVTQAELFIDTAIENLGE